MEVKIKVYPKQYDFISCDDRFTAFIGGIGSGKTTAGAIKALRYIKPGTMGLVVAPTYPMLRDATLRTFQDVAEAGITNFHKGEMRAEVGGGEVLFRSADTPDRLRGPNISFAWVDEAALCPLQTWDIVIGRLREGGKAGPCWVTSTPKGRNWLYQRSGEMRVFKASTEDNPYNAPEFVASLKAAYTGDFARQELYAEFVAFGGLVYDLFSRETHVRERSPEDIEYWVAGVDEGYTNPAVILAVGIDSDGRLHIAEEFYRRQRLQEDVVRAARQMHERYQFQRFVVDSSAAGLIAALQDAGLPALAHKGRVVDGISKMQNRLAVAGDGQPRLTVSPACANTIAEFESYGWRESKAGLKDEPVKANDHAMDAARYVVDHVDNVHTPLLGWA